MPAKDGTNRGRPEGSANRMAREAREHARATGDGRLPHEILLDIARGKPVQLVVPDKDGNPIFEDDMGTMKTKWIVPAMEDIRDCAKAAAPYYAPKMSTVEVLKGASEHELDQLIAQLAAEAGVSVGTGSQGEDQEGEGGEGEAGDGSGTPERSGSGQPTIIRRRPLPGT